MAIVKFISEKDCQLFIDMDFVGIIQADSMLKTTLVSGSYLVEVKDLNDELIEKYELKIGVDDNQLLQNLSQYTNSIKYSIDKLKNEPTLRFYNQRTKLEHDGKYGYVNSRYELVIDPMYSYAEDFICEKTLVKKQFTEKEMATIIDTNGNICYERWFEYIGCSNDTILLKNEDKFIVFLRKDFSILCEYYDAGYNDKGDLIPAYKKEGVDDNYGFIDKSGLEIVPFIYDFVCNFEESGYAIVKSYGHFYAVDKLGNLYGIERFDNCIGRIPSNEEEKKEQLCYGKEESIVKHTATEEKYYHTSKSDKFLFDSYSNTTFSMFFSHYVAYRVGELCILIHENLDCIEGTPEQEVERYEFKADSIEPITEFYFGLGIDGFTVRFVIIKRNRKYGLAKVSGEMLLQVEYDHIFPIIFCDDGDGGFRDWEEKRIDGFICKKEDEYIYINGKGKYMYPVEYCFANSILKDSGCPLVFSQFSTIS